MKNCPGHSGWKKGTIFAVATAAVGLIFFTLVITRPPDQEEEPKKTFAAEEAGALLGRVDSYLAAFPADRWIFKHGPGGSEQMDQFLATEMKIAARELDGQADLLSGIFSEFASVSPEAGNIAEAARNFSLGLCGQYEAPMKEFKKAGGASKALKICFIAKNLAPSHSNKPAFYHNGTHREMRALGVNWPRNVLAGRLFHELGHEILYAHPGRIDYQSPAYLDEEVAMHELEGMILNAATKGEYYRALDELIVNGEVKNAEELVLGLAVDGLRKINRIVGGGDYGQKVAGVIAFQAALNLGFRFITQIQGDAPDLKRQFYRAARSLSSQGRK